MCQLFFLCCNHVPTLHLHLCALQAYEAARLQRIHTRQEQCRHINKNVSVLLEQDAKRQGLEGTESVKRMPRDKTSAAVQSVARGFGKMGIQIESDLEMPKTEHS